MADIVQGDHMYHEGSWWVKISNNQLEKDLRDFHEKVFLALLSGFAAHEGYDPEGAVLDSESVAIMALRKHAAMTAERDAVIAEILEGER